MTLSSASEHQTRHLPSPTTQLIAILATIYAVVGALGMWLAIPPGYATPIFAATGVALAFLLTWGLRLWPGVWLGSFLLNCAIGGFSPGGLSVPAAVAAALIGLGAAAQAVVATLLVRRLVPGHALLDGARDIVRFLVVGGPLACVVSPLIGVGVLWGVGIVSTQDLPFNLWTWWVGDSIGVVIAAPLTLVVLRQREPLWRQRVWGMAVPSVAGLAIVIAVFVLASRWELQRVESGFREEALGMARRLDQSLSNYQEAVASVSRFVANVDVPSRQRFRNFVDRLFVQNPGIQALNWLPRVPAGERDGFEAQARREGYPAFRINELDQHANVRPAGKRDEYFPVFYREPAEASRAVLGFDLGSQADRLRAIEKARDSGVMTATGSVILFQGYPGFLLFAPVYDPSAGADTSDKRRAALKGFALGVFQLKMIVDTALDRLNPAWIAVTIEDVTPGSQRALIYGSAQEDSASGANPKVIAPLKVADRRWEVGFQALPAYLTAYRSSEAWVVLAAGLLLVGLLQAQLLVMTGETNRVRRRVEERTAELEVQIRERQDAEERQKLAIEGGDLGTWDWNVRTGELTVNERAAAMMGYSLEELAPRVETWRELLHPDDVERVMAAMRANLKGLAPFYEQECRARHKSGEWIWVMVKGRVIARDADGQALRACGTYLDITEARCSRDALAEVNQRLQASVHLLEQQRYEILQLNELGGTLQSCQTVNEACQAVSNFFTLLLPGWAGSIAWSNSEGVLFDVKHRWNEPATAAEAHFGVQDCWAMRRGKLHQVDADHLGLRCAHLAGAGPSPYLCVPLILQGKATGLLHLAQPGTLAPIDELIVQLVNTVAETLSLALASIQLQEELRAQAIRDPLTGLYNRRHMEDALLREIARAKRYQSPLGLMILDLDYFKRFNDTHGHDAGDELLREFAHCLRQSTREVDIACRFGGEEFVLIMPGASAEAMQRRAEELRWDIKAMSFTYQGRLVTDISASIGIALYLEDGLTSEALLRAADQALYKAKAQGRDRVVRAGTSIATDEPAQS